MKLTIQKEANLASPILRRVLGEHYQIETSRKLYPVTMEKETTDEKEPTKEEDVNER